MKNPPTEEHIQRALQIWQVLVSAAHNRQVLTYELVAERIGMGRQGAIAIRTYLGTIMKLCEKKRWPPLTVLVVEKGVGEPGVGLRTSKNRDKDRERVFEYKWFQELPPNPDDLRSVHGIP